MTLLSIDTNSQAADRDRLEGERLSAEFRAPLTRENCRHRLRHTYKAVQLDLGAPAPEPEAQGELFVRPDCVCKFDPDKVDW